MTIKTITQSGVLCGIMALAIVVPMKPDVHATAASYAAGSYQAFPTPPQKPSVCTRTQEVTHDNAYIDKRQAAAAALGLYLGISQATAPYKTDVNNRSLCS